MLLKLIYYPNKTLRKKSKKVNKINFKIKNIVYNMFKLMYKKQGIGLSAIQVGINKKIFIIDISKKNNKKLVFINPKILKQNGKIFYNEGCLSIPNFFGITKRYLNIKIMALNLNNNIFISKFTNLKSVCIQHEIDHLNGKLFIDFL
ncbi:MAG: peptide deformylase [Enterobacteriaceae bacterium PSpyr]|nr:MAG: peptide deformylase [Enterobacteriaceae bacterium PSpyr]